MGVRVSELGVRVLDLNSVKSSDSSSSRDGLQCHVHTMWASMLSLFGAT